jgi:hypothetical protein
MADSNEQEHKRPKATTYQTLRAYLDGNQILQRYIINMVEARDVFWEQDKQATDTLCERYTSLARKLSAKLKTMQGRELNANDLKLKSALARDFGITIALLRYQRDGQEAHIINKDTEDEEVVSWLSKEPSRPAPVMTPDKLLDLMFERG